MCVCEGVYVSVCMYERNLFVSLVSPSGFGEDLVIEGGGGGGGMSFYFHHLPSFKFL